MTELFQEFQEFRKILCVCPCCGDLVRISDLRLKVKGPVQKTWLDEYAKKNQLIDEKEEKFAEQEDKLRELAREKGRKAAQKVFNTSISPAFKALKYDPFDVKAILNPVDFLVFKGMNGDGVKDIVFLSKDCSNDFLKTIRKQVDSAITKNSYEWQVARIDDKGSILFE